MAEPYPPPTSTPQPSGYPVSLTFDLPDRVARWRPLVHWLLLIPHYIVMYVLGIVSWVMVIIAWFSGVILGRVPQTALDLLTMSQRYGHNVNAYAYFLHGTYPPFSFDAQTADTGADPHVHFDVAAAPDGRSRLTIFFRALMVIPHMVVLFFIGIAAFVVQIIGFFAVIILGRWPEGLRDFLLGYLRWNARVGAYYFLLTDEYPPFSLT